MRIVILHNAVSDKAAPDEADVLVQAEAVSDALRHLGHEPVTASCDLDLAGVGERLRELRPDVVFNLVESLESRGCLIHLAPALLDVLGFSYTGSPAEAIYCTSNKLVTKKYLQAARLPTPPWFTGEKSAGLVSFRSVPADPVVPGEKRYMIKSVWEHASVGLDGEGLVSHGALAHLGDRMEKKAALLGGSCFAELYIDGREFNLSLLTGPGGPEVLPPAEIVFDDFPPDKLRIVGYRAKWDPDSFEYRHTPRRFDYPPSDASLLEELKKLAQACWRQFNLRGYARVDFRVDRRGQPWILEVNANPCLSPDAGFAAALERAEISYAEAIRRILEDRN